MIGRKHYRKPVRAQSTLVGFLEHAMKMPVYKNKPD
jgi:hypothetical protein